MKKWTLITAAITVGITICLLAPAWCQLVGIFCVGGGLYAAVEVMKVQKIGREIARYETLPRTKLQAGLTAPARQFQQVKERKRGRRKPVLSPRSPNLTRPLVVDGWRARARTALWGRRSTSLSDRRVSLAHTILFFYTI